MSEPSTEPSIAAAPTPAPICFICGTAAAGAARALPGSSGEVVLRTCGECRARMRRARDSRDLALTEEGRGYALWKGFDIAGAYIILAAGFFIAVWAGWADARLVWGGWISLALTIPVGVLVFFLIVRYDRRRPMRWAASDEKKRHDALISEVRAKLTAAGVPDTELTDTALIDPRTWEAPP